MSRTVGGWPFWWHEEGRAKAVPRPLKLSLAAKYRFLGGDNFTGEGRYKKKRLGRKYGKIWENMPNTFSKDIDCGFFLKYIFPYTSIPNTVAVFFFFDFAKLLCL